MIESDQESDRELVQDRVSVYMYLTSHTSQEMCGFNGSLASFFGKYLQWKTSRYLRHSLRVRRDRFPAKTAQNSDQPTSEHDRAVHEHSL